MSNRSRYLVLTAAAGGAFAARRLRWRRALEGVGESVLTGHQVELPSEHPPATDEAHAPGHHHLPPADGTGGRPSRSQRPWERFVAGHRDRLPDR